MTTHDTVMYLNGYLAATKLDDLTLDQAKSIIEFVKTALIKIDQQPASFLFTSGTTSTSNPTNLLKG